MQYVPAGRTGQNRQLQQIAWLHVLKQFCAMQDALVYASGHGTTDLVASLSEVCEILKSNPLAAQSALQSAGFFVLVTSEGKFTGHMSAVCQAYCSLLF